MITAPIPIHPILQNAAAALKRGDKHAARRWAQAAAAMVPQSEEPWLLLAAVSEPRASLAYLQQALLLNPGSERALRGLRWAQSRLAKQQAGLAKPVEPAKLVEFTKPVKPAKLVELTKPMELVKPAEPAKLVELAKLVKLAKPVELAGPPLPLPVTQPTRLQSTVKVSTPKLSGRRLVVLPVIFLALLCLALAWAAWPASASFALSLIRSGNPTERVADGPSWSQAEIAKPASPASVVATASPVGTSTTIPTATPTLALPAPVPQVQVSASPTGTMSEGPTSTPALSTAEGPPPTPTALPTDTAYAPAPAPGIGTQPAPATGKYILISISEQHLYAYQGNTLVSSFVASTGMNNSTRVGVFQVLDKIPNAYGANWNIWMPNWLGIYYSGSLENGIHALPILSNGVRLWAGYLGTPISFGCIVLGVEESQWLYNWADVGTTVEIRR